MKSYFPRVTVRNKIKFNFLFSVFLIGLLAGCVTTPQYNSDPLASFAESGPEVIQSNLKMGVILNENTHKVIRYIEEHAAANMEMGAARQEDANYLLEEINKILRSRFTEIVPLNNPAEMKLKKVDMSVTIDLRAEFGSFSGTETRIEIKGIFMDSKGSVFDTISGSASNRVPWPAWGYRIKPALRKALKSFSENLDGSKKLVAESKRLSKTRAALAAESQPKTDTTPPSIVITSHRVARGIQVIENLSKTMIVGKATDPSGVAEVKVNGQTTSLDEDGRFTADVFLKVGDNKIVISAMDVRENIGRKIFTIKRNPKTAMVRRSEVLGQKDFGRYYALIVGNNNYKHLPKLETPRNDAKEIERVLRELYGFETEVLLDATRYDILNRLNKLRDRLEENDSFLFYYAGHGQLDKSSDKAYWLPIDAEPNNDSNWILAERITSNIKRYSSNHIMIVADSCFSGAMTRSVNSQISAGKAERDKYLKKMLNKPSRTLMASGGNEPVADVGGEGHSVFAQVLLNALTSIENKIFTAEELFYSHIKEAVAGRSGQTPEYSIIRNSGHEGGDFLFVRE